MAEGAKLIEIMSVCVEKRFPKMLSKKKLNVLVKEKKT